MPKSIRGVAALLLCSLSSLIAQQRPRTFLAPGTREIDPRQVSAEIQELTWSDRKSVTLAVLYSLVLPGMGELYAGTFSSGKYSLVADAGLWVTYGAFITKSDWVRRDARGYAAQHAGANFSAKDAQFEVNIGNYMSLSDYNQAKLRNRESGALYTAPEYQWQWDSDANRQSFKDQRIHSDGILQDSKFVIAALVVNRIFSAFAAGRAVLAFNRDLRADDNWRLSIVPTQGPTGTGGLEMRLSAPF